MGKHSEKKEKREKSHEGLKVFFAVIIMLVVAGAILFALDKFNIIDLSSVKEFINNLKPAEGSSSVIWWRKRTRKTS